MPEFKCFFDSDGQKWIYEQKEKGAITLDALLEPDKVVYSLLMLELFNEVRTEFLDEEWQCLIVFGDKDGVIVAA